MLRDALLEKAREQMEDGNVARYAAEVAEHKRDPYTLVEEIVGRIAEGLVVVDERHRMFTIDHLGIAVKSLAAAKGIYEKLGLTASAEEVGRRRAGPSGDAACGR